MADNENPPIVETTVDGEPGTGEQNDTTPKADSNDLADKVSMWQAMSRENEKKSHANLKRATDAESKLADVEHQYAQAQTQIAKLKAQAAYPQLTDEVFAALAPKDADAEAIEEWAKNASQFILPAQTETVADEGKKEEQQQPLPASVLAGYSHTAPPPQGSTASGGLTAAYDNGRKFASINNDKK